MIRQARRNVQYAQNHRRTDKVLRIVAQLTPFRMLAYHSIDRPYPLARRFNELLRSSWCTSVPLDTLLAQLVMADPAIEVTERDMVFFAYLKLAESHDHTNQRSLAA